MPRFDNNDLSQRRETVANAKKAMVERFRARPKDDDPVIQERKAARIAVSKAREERIAAREEARRVEAERQAIELKLREEEAARLAKEQEEREAIERRAEADRAVELLNEQKAARDARYAARKARRR